MVRFLGFHILAILKNIPFFVNSEYIVIKKDLFLKKIAYICVCEHTFKIHPFFAKLGTIMRTHWSIRVTPLGNTPSLVQSMLTLYTSLTTLCYSNMQFFVISASTNTTIKCMWTLVIVLSVTWSTFYQTCLNKKKLLKWHGKKRQNLALWTCIQWCHLKWIWFSK